MIEGSAYFFFIAFVEDCFTFPLLLARGFVTTMSNETPFLLAAYLANVSNCGLSFLRLLGVSTSTIFVLPRFVATMSGILPERPIGFGSGRRPVDA